MSLRADLESKTVPELKQICKDCDVKGYSKLAKDALIVAILEKKGQGTNLEQSLARSVSKSAPDPTTEQFLQRTSTKVVFSRDESEARIEKNKGLVAKRAEVSGVATEKATDSEAGAQLVKATMGKGQSRQQAVGGKSSSPSSVATPATGLASTLSTAHEAPARLTPVATSPVPAKKAKLVVQPNQIQKVSQSERPLQTVEPEQKATREVTPAAVDTTAPAAAKKPSKRVVTAESIQKGTPTTPVAAEPATSKKSTKMVVKTEKIQKVAPAATSVQAPPEPKEMRFQDLPSDDRERAFKNVSKNVQKLLKMRKPDFLKKKAKDLEKYLELLEVEKGRFTVYRPTDKALRGFMDESIALINQVKEEQLNQLEQQYIAHELPKAIKKNEKKIKQHVTRIDRYYTDMDAARDIVEKYIKKAPFPQSYLITVVLQKIRDKAL